MELQIHTLSTEDKSWVKYHDLVDTYIYHKPELGSMGAKPYHIYFTSLEKSKKGDVCIDVRNREVFKSPGAVLSPFAYKIIATTDPKVLALGITGILSISKEDLPKIVGALNKGNKVENWLYRPKDTDDDGDCEDCINTAGCHCCTYQLNKDGSIKLVWGEEKEEEIHRQKFLLVRSIAVNVFNETGLNARELLNRVNELEKLVK